MGLGNWSLAGRFRFRGSPRRGRRSIILSAPCLQLMDSLFIETILSASDNLGLSFTIRAFGFFEDVDEMLALGVIVSTVKINEKSKRRRLTVLTTLPDRSTTAIV